MTPGTGRSRDVGATPATPSLDLNREWYSAHLVAERLTQAPDQLPLFACAVQSVPSALVFRLPQRLQHDVQDDTMFTMDPSRGSLRVHRVIVFIVNHGVGAFSLALAS